MKWLKRNRTSLVVFCSVLALALAGLGIWYGVQVIRGTRYQRVYDEAGIIPSGDIPRFEDYLRWIFEESDVDIRFVLVESLGGSAIEDAAIKRMQELKIGAQGREERGVLFLYDMSGQRLRIEVGYGLEEYFPDAFVNYLMHDHARAFFSSGDLSLGLRLTLRMLQDRVRSAVLGDRFDPRPLAIIKKAGYLSGGGGVSTAMALRQDPTSYLRAPLDPETRARFMPQASPGITYLRYLDWLSMGRFDPSVTIFTSETSRYLASLPMSRAYFDYILLREYGREYKINERGHLALLYFTNDPFIDPHFFRKGKNGWQIDLVAEVRNTRNRVGGVYTWDYGGKDDDFSRTFSDKFVKIKGYVRIADGDNRQLPTRVSR